MAHLWAHLWAHPFAVVGLAVIMLGTVRLVFSPPTVTEYTKEGNWVPPGASMSELGRTPDEIALNKRRHKRQRWGFHFAIGALIVGFVLQLVDLFCT